MEARSIISVLDALDIRTVDVPVLLIHLLGVGLEQGLVNLSIDLGSAVFDLLQIGGVQVHTTLALVVAGLLGGALDQSLEVTGESLPDALGEAELGGTVEMLGEGHIGLSFAEGRYTAR